MWTICTAQYTRVLLLIDAYGTPAYMTMMTMTATPFPAKNQTEEKFYTTRNNMLVMLAKCVPSTVYTIHFVQFQLFKSTFKMY